MRTEHSSEDIRLLLPVRFVETDQMGVVHHSVYAVWLEAGRVAWMTAAGLPYDEFAAQGFNLAVTELTIQYRAPATFGDTVEVLTLLTTLRSRKVSFDYEVRNSEKGTLLATAKTEHICVNERGKMARIPQEVLDQMKNRQNAQ